MIKSKQLAKALFELSLADTKNLDSKVVEFIEKRKLKAQIPSVLYHLDKIIELEKEKHGIQIETAHVIKPETVKKIKTFLNASDLSEVLKVKKDLIGGFRAKYNGVIYDASIATGIKKLKEAIVK
jgi:F0F1-type ATP synthase delta subunit